MTSQRQQSNQTEYTPSQRQQLSPAQILRTKNPVHADRVAVSVLRRQYEILNPSPGVRTCTPPG